MAKSTVISDDITFSAGSEIYAGAAQATGASLRKIGLLGEDIDFGVQQEFREKTDQFPRQVVKRSILSQAASLQFICKEFNIANLQLAFGILDAGVTTVAAGDTAVTDEAVTFNSDGVAVLAYPLKAGESITSVQDAAGGSGTASVEDTDFVVVDRDLQGRTLLRIISGGNLSALDTVYVDYTYNQGASNSFVIGSNSTTPERAIRLLEDYDNGKQLELYMPRAFVGIPGNMTLNAAETGGELPMSVQALYDTTLGGVARATLIEAS